MPRINLSQFGLSSEEEKIYLALISFGVASVVRLENKVGLRRTTIYYHLQHLIDQGLVSESFEGGKKQYFPAAADHLKKIFQKKEKEFLIQKENVQLIIERINNLQKSVTKLPEARIYKGRLGLEVVMKDILETRKDIYFIGSHDAILEDDKLISTEKFLRNFTAKRRQKGDTKAYIISDFSKISLRQKGEEDEVFREVKIWPELKGMNGGIVVCGSNIVMYGVGEEAIAYVVKNEIVAGLMEVILKQLWKSL